MDALMIGEAARAAGVSAKAVRLWEARGLLPLAPRNALGHRAFTEADITRLRFIRQAKALGLTLGEIGEVIQLQQSGMSPCHRVAQAIDTHLAKIDRQLGELARLRDVLVAAKKASVTLCPSDGQATVCQIIEQVRPAG